MDKNFRDRFNYVERRVRDDADVGAIWKDQRSMQVEDEQIKRDLLASKKKAKELSRKLRRHRYGELKNGYSETITLVRRRLEPFIARSSTVISLLRTRLRVVREWTRSHKKFAVPIGVFVVTLSVISSMQLFGGDSSPTGTLGNRTVSSSGLPIAELPRVKPEFSLLLPQSKDPKDFDIVRISPDGNAPAYAFLDRLTEDGPIFRVTEQEVPDKFELGKTATEFQATSVIQIDGMPVYHGYTEKGGTHTLIFVKDKRLIFIRSPHKYDDDTWASYIIGLQ